MLENVMGTILGRSHYLTEVEGWPGKVRGKVEMGKGRVRK